MVLAKNTPEIKKGLVVLELTKTAFICRRPGAKNFVTDEEKAGLSIERTQLFWVAKDIEQLVYYDLSSLSCNFK